MTGCATASKTASGYASGWRRDGQMNAAWQAAQVRAMTLTAAGATFHKQTAWGHETCLPCCEAMLRCMAFPMGLNAPTNHVSYIEAMSEPLKSAFSHGTTAWLPQHQQRQHVDLSNNAHDARDTDDAHNADDAPQRAGSFCPLAAGRARGRSSCGRNARCPRPTWRLCAGVECLDAAIAWPTDLAPKPGAHASPRCIFRPARAQRRRRQGLA